VQTLGERVAIRFPDRRLRCAANRGGWGPIRAIEDPIDDDTDLIRGLAERAGRREKEKGLGAAWVNPLASAAQ